MLLLTFPHYLLSSSLSSPSLLHLSSSSYTSFFFITLYLHTSPFLVPSPSLLSPSYFLSCIDSYHYNIHLSIQPSSLHNSSSTSRLSLTSLLPLLLKHASCCSSSSCSCFVNIIVNITSFFLYILSCHYDYNNPSYCSPSSSSCSCFIITIIIIIIVLLEVILRTTMEKVYSRQR